MAYNPSSGGDYSQDGQQFSQFAPRRRKYGMQSGTPETSALDQALDGEPNQGQFAPPTGGINPDGMYSGGNVPPGGYGERPRSAPPGQPNATRETTAADQLTQQQAVNQALTTPPPTVEQLQQTIRPRGGSGTLGTAVSTGASVGGALAGGAIGGAWGGPIGIGIGMLGGLIAYKINQHKKHIANDISANDARAIVAATYREQLGRDPTPEEVDSHLKNAGGTVSEWVNPDQYNNAIRSISSSPEALAYASRQAVSTAPASTPASTTTTGAPSSSALPGWDQAKWANTQHTTPKYVVGRILSQYAPDQAGYNAAVAEIQKQFPGATGDGKDKITLPGVGTFDIRTGASQGGTGWAWQPLTNPDGSPVQGAQGPSGPSSSGGGFMDMSWAAGGANNTTKSLIQKLMEELALANSLR